MSGSMATRNDLARSARRLFSGAPPVTRLLQSLRPYICPFEEIIDFVPANSRVLDLGCGSGLFLGLLWQAGKLREGVGCDTSASAVNVARATTSSLGPGFSVLRF